MFSFPFTFRQLEVFASLCSTGSFRRSAEGLGISQASVSNQIKVLEEQLGIALFTRSPGQRPTLTPEGMAFRNDLHSFEEVALALASHRRREGGQKSAAVRYRILVGQGLLDNFIRPKLDRFQSQYPTIELMFEARQPSNTLARDLQDGQYDFAMIHRRADRAVESYFRELALSRGGIYGHRKFTEGRSLPLPAEEVNLLPFIMPLAASAQENEMLQFFARFGIRPRMVVGHTQYYDVMAAMLDRGVGVSSFADAILPVEMRDDVVLLHPLEHWRLLWFRKDKGEDERAEPVQSFLQSCVLQDPNYLTIDEMVEA